MIVLPGLVNVDLHKVLIVHLLHDVLVHVGCNFWFVGHLAVQGLDSLCSSVVVYVVDVLNGDLVVDGVKGGVLYDVLNAFLLGQLV